MVESTIQDFKFIAENYSHFIRIGGIICTVFFTSLGVFSRIAWYFIKQYLENIKREQERADADRKRWANIESDISIIRITEEGRDSFVKGLQSLVTEIKVMNEHIKNSDEKCNERHRWDGVTDRRTR